jgi:hypothetical protein
MPRTLTFAAVGLAFLASVSIARADDIATPAPSDGTPQTADSQSGATQQSDATTNTGSADASAQASGEPTQAATDGGASSSSGSTQSANSGTTPTDAASNQTSSTGDVSQVTNTTVADDPAAVASGGPALTVGSGNTVIGYGVFRENVPDAPLTQRNCWVQAMIQGDTIRGELLAERVTFAQAQCVLARVSRRGLCANQRTDPLWTARTDQGADGGWSDRWSSNTSSDSTGGTINVTAWNQTHASPGRRPHDHRTWNVSNSGDGSTDGSAGDASSDGTSSGTTPSTPWTGSYWVSNGCGAGDQANGGHHHRSN